MWWIVLAVATAAPVDELTRWAAGLEPPDPTPEVATEYRFTGDFYPQLAAIAKEKPGAVEVEAIGTTLGRRPIWAFHVSEPGIEIERKVLVFAGIHALEWISTEVAVDLLLELMRHPPRGTRVTVIPVLNVDGRFKVERDLLAGVNTYRRGNLAQVDLNRNFAVNREARAFWRTIIPGYYHTSGKTPLSEAESSALDELCAREGYDRAASLHAFGGYLYYPWTGVWARPDDYDAFVALGRAMEDAQGAFAYRTRQLSRWGFFFRAQGTEIDHLYGQYGTKAFLVEMTRSGWDWRHPFESLRTYFRWYNPVHPRRHRQRGVAAMRALITAPDTER